MHAKLERLLSKSLITLEVMAYYLVVHTGPGLAPGTVATGVSILKSPVCTKIHGERGDQTEVCRSRGRTLDHWANKAVKLVY